MSLFDSVKTFVAAWTCTKEESAPQDFTQKIRTCVAQTSQFTGSDGLPASNFQLVCSVLILVLLEFTFWAILPQPFVIPTAVLILVLLEFTFWG